MKLLKNQIGAGLINVIIGAGLLGVGAVVVMKQTEILSGSYEQTENDAKLLDFSNQIQNSFMNNDLCIASVNGFEGKTITQIDQQVNKRILSSSLDILVEEGVRYGEFELDVKNISYIEKPYGFVIKIDVLKDLGKRSASGGKAQQEVSVLTHIYADFNPDNTIRRCRTNLSSYQATVNYEVSRRICLLNDGTFNSTTGECLAPGFGGITCPTGEYLVGFDYKDNSGQKTYEPICRPVFKVGSCNNGWLKKVVSKNNKNSNTESINQNVDCLDPKALINSANTIFENNKRCGLVDDGSGMKVRIACN